MRKHCTGSYQSAALLALVAFVVCAVGDVAYARPGFGANCAQCHTTSAGSVDASPDPLMLLPGAVGDLTLDAQLPAGTSSAALSLSGLNDPELATSIASAGWIQQADGRFTLSGITTSGPMVVELATNPSAIPGDYPIGVFLAGQPGFWSTSTDFVIRVIPEPASAGLLLAIGGALSLRRFRRRRMR